MPISLEKYIDVTERLTPVDVRGAVTQVNGSIVKAVVPGVSTGDLCQIDSTRDAAPLMVEVIGFSGAEAILMPFGDIDRIPMRAAVRPTDATFTVKVGNGLLGRVLNGLGQPVDGKGTPNTVTEYPVKGPAPNPMDRARVGRILRTGIKAVDGVLTAGEGQRIGIFAAAGVGKSELLGMLARNSEADVNVIALIGERGREVRDFLEDNLGGNGLRRSVVVVATSNEPAMVRLKAAYVATAIAEYFRDQKRRVLLLFDSVTRFARALREVGLTAGEPPTRVGFPPSVFAELPKLFERAGNSAASSITAFYTVLVEGDDLTEPIADETISILDGHIVLSRTLAAAGHFPAIDINRSVSRVMPKVIVPGHGELARKLRQVLATFEAQRDLIMIGAYKKGSDPRTDYALSKLEAVNAFLKQAVEEHVEFDQTIQELETIFA